MGGILVSLLFGQKSGIEDILFKIYGTCENRMGWLCEVTWIKLKKVNLSLKFINSSNIW